MRGMLMCQACHHIDIPLQRFSILVGSPGLDQLSLTMIRMSIKSLEEEKALLRKGRLSGRP